MIAEVNQSGKVGIVHGRPIQKKGVYRDPHLLLDLHALVVVYQQWWCFWSGRFGPCWRHCGCHWLVCGRFVGLTWGFELAVNKKES